VATQAGQIDERPNKDHHLDWVMKENTPGEGLEKQITRSLSKPVATESDGAQANSNRLIQERLPSGMGTAERANGPATHPVQPIAGQAKGPESIVTGLADQQAPSSDDDTANFQGSAKHNPTQRVAVADINEDEVQKGQASDSVKSTVSELTKSPPSFQDTEKALTGDQSTNMAVKPTTGQAPALTRTEDSAAKTFQTTVMDQIVDKAAMRSIHGRSEIQIRLKPEFLGNVQMNIAADKEQLVVRILTDRPMVKEIIETHLHQLRTELQNHGLTIDKFEVMVNPDAEQQNSRDQFAQMFKHHSSQNGRRQPHEQEPETLSRDGSKNPDDDQPNRDGVNYFA
jgi:flagellar hook-length control protein FliK